MVVEDNAIGPCGTDVDGLGVRVDPKATRITVRGNEIHDVSSGLYARQALNPIVFEGNRVVNVRGPMPRGQMLQFDSVTGGGGQSRVVGNTSDRSAATITTHYEDHVNLYKSSGTAGRPILIACNRIRGGDSDTGSGVMVGDNGGGYVTIRDNVVVLTPNTGIGIAGGHDVTVSGNLVYNRGANVASKTSVGMSLFTYAGNVPRAITLTGNRMAANSWQNGADGSLGDGFYTDRTATNLVETGNLWRDTSLTAGIWNTLPAACG